jgi:hypothetical protein
MIKNRLLFLIFVFLGPLNISFAQQPLLAKYIIITFEDSYKISQDDPRDYYWIIPQDSLNSNDNTLSHLYLRNFSKNNLIDCCNGKNIDPEFITSNTNYDFDSSYFKDFDNLEKILARKRVKVQTITKKWKNGQQEDIIIFATPVSGKFCSSGFHSLGLEEYGYEGQVSIPYSSFTYSEEFWKSNKAKFILNRDFSKVKYNIIPN